MHLMLPLNPDCNIAIYALPRRPTIKFRKHPVNDYTPVLDQSRWSHSPGLVGLTLPVSLVSLSRSRWSHSPGLVGLTLPVSLVSLSRSRWSHSPGLIGLTLPVSLVSLSPSRNSLGNQIERLLKANREWAYDTNVCISIKIYQQKLIFLLLVPTIARLPLCLRYGVNRPPKQPWAVERGLTKYRGATPTWSAISPLASSSSESEHLPGCSSVKLEMMSVVMVGGRAGGGMTGGVSGLPWPRSTSLRPLTRPPNLTSSSQLTAAASSM
ncbi:hypothetical protein BD769DRAFT_1675378 [Suillus cothurnatus]|nr:hypothetical protein BD769DRAFT_1675378 [Suillus cothurnatus]